MHVSDVESVRGYSKALVCCCLVKLVHAYLQGFLSGLRLTAYYENHKLACLA
jgi:hypothetical protein